ncbi:aminopeptidase P family protein [Pseudorhodobacter turbinis]|uniref:Aminopeptidase P family protein n=1 Tax=Pseudorhodobacter turbinis TaxID=2500533 RepID=A0A4P8EDR3_9RHOB|nr:Xaa-Pro peptidase family protein [Pseudorhodobacter turbinis]QCO54966.1 aminopeptidase P family protein [Pseudorhodobacter turbinis]
MTDRYAEHRAIARDLGVDAIALVPGSNFERLYNASFGSHERPMVIIIPVIGAPVALVPNLELLSFEALGFEGAVFDWRDQTGYSDAFAAMAAHLPLTSLAVEGQVMRVFVHHALATAYPGLRILDAEAQISGLRLRKTPDEISALTAAIRLSEAALAETIAEVKPGMTERQVESLLVAALFRNGADGLSFGPIVAAGGNAAMPHAHARDVAIAPGDALLIDFGGRKDGFTADITRTFFIGHADDRAHQVYDTVLRANMAGHAVTRAGVTAHLIDDAVTSVLEASAFADYIRTKTGHGLGRDVHEAPYIMRGNHEVLAAGTVFTNEPGLYIPNEIGVRIEDDILVTDGGALSLTEFPKDLTVIS